MARPATPGREAAAAATAAAGATARLAGAAGAQPPSDAASRDDIVFNAERLRVLVEYSTALRLQMWSAAAVIALVLWLGGHGWPLALLWLVAVLGVRELRAAWLVRLLERPPDELAASLRTVSWLTLAFGAAYGSAALFMPGIDTAYRAILTMILLSISAGAISTTFSVLPAFVMLGAAITLPAALVWLATGEPLSLGLGIAALMLMALGVQVRFARQTLNMFEQSFRMRQSNTALLNELSAERSRLAQARDAAVAADLAKSRFLAAASHDLRQPLQSLALNSGALSRMPMDAECRQITTEMAVGIEALSRMLDGLLDISQLDAGAVAPTLQPMMVDRLLQGMQHRFAKAAEAKGLTLEVRCPPGLTVVSDAQMLQRVLSNLVDNALKFTTVGGVTLGGEPREGRVRVTVGDSGCGIPPTQRGRIFDDLVQLHNPQRDRAAGHGLGLGIVRRICRLLGVEIEVESQLGSGTRMHLTLPAAAPAALVADAAVVEPGLVARRVLVLDDDAAVRAAYQHALRSLGCEVTTAGNIAEALAVLPEARPDVALVDYRLADNINGLEAIAQLRSRRPALLALIVSAETGAELLAEAARAGVPILRKPVTDTLLAMSINKLLVDFGEPSDQTDNPGGSHPGPQ